jgi:hypothetical protein
MQDTYLERLERRYLLQRFRPRWTAALQRAAEKGVDDARRREALDPKIGQEGVDRDIPYATPDTHAPKGDATKRIDALRKQTSDPSKIDIAHITDAVNALSKELRAKNKIDDARLSSDHKELLLLLDSIYNTALAREYQAALTLNTAFSGDVPAPTRMGNVAAAIEAYGMQRYGIDLTVLWSRLQATLVKGDAKDLSSVLDAKTQLDFLVACCCFSALTALVWLALLPVIHGPLVSYLVIAPIGVALTWGLSRVATQAYLAYAITLRACVDVNRFALLRALELPLPSTLHAELRIWNALSSSATSGNTAELSYEHPAK